MINTHHLFSGYTMIIPLVIGAFLSGIFYLSEGSSIPLTIFQLSLVFSFILFFIKKIIERDTSIELYGLEKWYLLFFTIIAFSIIYTPERAQALLYFIRFTVLISMTYVIYNTVKSERDIVAISIAFILIATIVASMGIIQSYLNPENLVLNYVNQGRNLIRASGVETDPNVYASNFFIPVMLSVTLFLGDISRKLKVLLFLSILIFLVAILLTYSRSAWVSIFLGLLILIFLTKKFNFLIYGAVALVIVLSSSETMQNFSISLFNRLLDVFAGTQDDSSNIRILLAKASVLMFFDSYLVGVGFQGFSTAFQNYYTPQETIGIYEPHNEFYTVYSELGIFGFFIFMIIIVSIYKRAKNNINLSYKKNNLRMISMGLYVSFICYLIFYQFYGGMFYNSILMILIGLIFGVSKLGTERDTVAILKSPNRNISSNYTS
ncbi:MAG: O-antigen ligase family protein [Balneolaceae bacterium]